MNPPELIRDILKLTVGCDWLLMCVPFGKFTHNFNICIVTKEPLRADIKDTIKKILYENTPVIYGYHLTFARKKRA